MRDEEQLVRYCLGDLPAEEAASLEERLERDPALAARLEELRECFAAGGENCCEADPQELPESLADRTAHAVMARCADAESVGPTTDRRFSLTEVMAVGAAALVLGMITLPAIQSARDKARRVQCAGNFKSIGDGVRSYAEYSGGSLPPVAPGLPAGIVTVLLAEGGHVDRGELQRYLVCPSSSLADQVADGEVTVRVPSRAQLFLAPERMYALLTKYMGGSQAFRLGHVRGSVYVYPRFNSSSRLAFMADAPTQTADGALMGKNHGACGQNVLYVDGHVGFQSGCWTSGDTDHLFLNDRRIVAAGVGARDTVLAPSDATPGVPRLVRHDLSR